MAPRPIRRTEKDGGCTFTTIPFEPNTANIHIKSYFGGAKFVHVIATLPILGLKFIKLFSAFL